MLSHFDFETISFGFVNCSGTKTLRLTYNSIPWNLCAPDNYPFFRRFAYFATPAPNEFCKPIFTKAPKKGIFEPTVTE